MAEFVEGLPLTRLEGVISATNLGEWVEFDAVANSGSMAGRALSRNRAYGVRHPTLGERYVCGVCGEVYATLTAADVRHRQRTHRRQRGEHFKDSRAVAVFERPRPPAAVVAEEAPEQMTMPFDEGGLDVIGEHLIEGMGAIVASRRGLRQRVAELEAENARLRTMIEAVKTAIGGTE